MASPQTENGYLKIANELFEELPRIKLSSYEIRILLVLLRKTYGWGKIWDKISLSQFSEATGINRNHISRTLNKLVKYNIIKKRSLIMRQSGKPYSVEYCIQKDYDAWHIKGYRLSDTRVGSTPTGSTSNGIEVAPQLVLTKETIQKKEKAKAFSSKVIKNLFREWNITMAGVKVRKIDSPEDIDPTSNRYRFAKARMKENYFINNYKEAMKKVAVSDFCNGRVVRTDGKKIWRANIDWFLRSGTVMSIKEGIYDNESGKTKPEEPIPPSEMFV